ncbi:MAG: phospho-sugar mutase, partial [Bacilli bacterium]
LQALVMYAEMANFYLQKGLLLDEVYRQIQEEFGYHDDTIDSVTFPGLEGLKAMNAMLARLREKPLTNIDGIKIIKTTDYLTGIEKSAAEEKLVSLPQSDVISYLLETGDRVIIRPSGTEPKCKFYYSICRKSLLEATTAKEQIKRAFEKLTK